MADKLKVRLNKQLLARRVDHIKTAWLVPPILTGGFVLGYMMAPTTTAATPDKLSPPQPSIFMLINSWISHYVQLLRNVKQLAN